MKLYAYYGLKIKVLYILEQFHRQFDNANFMK